MAQRGSEVRGQVARPLLHVDPPCPEHDLASCRCAAVTAAIEVKASTRVVGLSVDLEHESERLAHEVSSAAIAGAVLADERRQPVRAQHPTQHVHLRECLRSGTGVLERGQQHGPLPVA